MEKFTIKWMNGGKKIAADRKELMDEWILPRKRRKKLAADPLLTKKMQ